MRAGLRQPMTAMAAALLLAVPAAAAASAPEEPPAVRARVVERAWRPDGRGVEPDAGSQAADVVILENAQVRATVVPALGGRVVQVHFKGAGRDLFAGGDAGPGFVRAKPRSAGAKPGAGFRFPHPEAEAAPGEGISWRIVRADDGTVTVAVRADDGTVTVAVDRRFRQFTGPRAGRFSPLRMGTLVTLRPASSVLEVTGRVDNPLPLRQGFRLWYAARFPAPAGTGVLVGVYDPRADANHLLIRPTYAAPGTAVHLPDGRAPAESGVARPASPDGERRAILGAGQASPAAQAGSGPRGPARRPAPPTDTLDVAVGSNVTAGHPGHYLPPFGAYGVTVRLAMVRGIGPVVWADERMAVGLRRDDGATGLRVVGLGPAQKVRLVLRAGGRREEVTGRLAPDRPLAAELPGRHDRVRLTVLDEQDDELADVTVPPRAGPVADEVLAALGGQMDPWDWQAMELAGWHPPPGRVGLPAAVGELTRSTAKVSADRLLTAARVLMLAETPGAGPWQAVRNRLAFRTGGGDHQATAHAYVALMLTLEAGGRPTAESARHDAKGCPVLGALYVRALRALAAGDMMTGLRHLRQCTEQAPPIAMGLGDRALPGGDRLHPSAWPGGQWPTLLRAVVRLEIKQPRRAISILDRLLHVDPSRPEAVALLADAYTRLSDRQTPQAAADRRRALALRAEADRLLASSPPVRRALDALLEEARLGRWSGIPRP